MAEHELTGSGKDGPGDLLAKLANIREPGIRVALLCEAFAKRRPVDIAELLTAIIERTLTGEAPGQDGLLALCRAFPLLIGDVPTYRVVGETYALLMQTESEIARSAARLLLTSPPVRKATTRQLRGGPRWGKEVTLGEKKTFASGGNRNLLERLVYDADPSVIEKLARNPRIREQDILTIVTRRPTRQEVLDVIIRSRWVGRYEVRKALVMSPYTNTGSVLRLLPLLHGHDIAALRHVGGLHALVTETAGMLTELRSALLERDSLHPRSQ